jgi:formylglycine-generating enzyme required for sulfatase activity
VQKLGEGGFGQVWKARDDGGFEVALKFLRLDGRAGATELRALEVMKNVRHAHVLPMFRSWQVGGWLVLALELGEKTLYQRLAEVEKQGQVGIPRPELLEYMLEAAKGLDYLHTLNIQHRDVKPQNLLLVGGSVKVADFGLAKLLEQSLASNSGSMTVAYAAPEQFQGLVSPHSDQYSLAVSWCQFRGGRLPFRGTQHQIMYGHVHGQPDLSGLPESEWPAVAKALSKKPEQRWPSCRAFVEALAASVTTVRPGDAAPTLRTTAVYPKRRWRWYAVGGGLVLSGVLAAGIVAGLLTRGAGVPTATTGMARPSVGPPGTVRTADGPAKSPEAVPESRPVPVEAVRRLPEPLDCTGETGVSAADVRKAQEAWAEYYGRKVEETVEIADGVTMTFVLVPPGKFRMGSPENEADRASCETPHTVVLTRPFDLGMHEVTQAQYRALVTRARSEELRDPDPSKFKGARLPVEQVSWDEADAFGRALTKLRSDRHVYRLPTEAEWEYGCRGGRPSSQPFGIGDGHALSSLQANFDGGNPYGGADKENSINQTNKVGSYKANALGLCDMHGNVWEWCRDWYADELAGGHDPQGPPEGAFRSNRGGAWGNVGAGCRSASRCGLAPGSRYDFLGFRVARVASDER